MNFNPLRSIPESQAVETFRGVAEAVVESNNGYIYCIGGDCWFKSYPKETMTKQEKDEFLCPECLKARRVLGRVG